MGKNDSVGVFHALCNLQLSDKNENVSKYFFVMMHIWFLAWNINTCAIGTTTYHTFPVYQCILKWCICTYCRYGHVRLCCKDMTTIQHHRVLYVSNRLLFISPDLMFWEFWFRYFNFFKFRPSLLLTEQFLSWLLHVRIPPTSSATTHNFYQQGWYQADRG